MNKVKKDNMPTTKPTTGAPKRRGRPPKVTKAEDKANESVEVTEAVKKYIENHHDLRVSLYQCGVSYGRMMESRQQALVVFGLWILIGLSLLSVCLDWWPWLKEVFALLWIVEFIVLGIWTDKQVKQHIAEETKRLEEFRDNELKEVEDK